ncbi:MAG: hypothetical protein A2X31_08265 [Elusimicrobia bacterium GWB2_63_22]|nr:MAG: hypothetical protein A2X31_08265 [Elusimicrobia bacterium GWB2_63_22]
MKTPLSEELLGLFAPDPEALLNRLRPLINDRMLAVIAGADYGNEAEEHLRELKPIRDNGAVPAPVHWHPKEVLDLTQWLMPEHEDPRWKAGLSLRENHLIRLFSCAALLRIAGELENDGYFDGENQTIAPLAHSAMFLGEELQRDALSLLAWRLKLDRDLGEDAPFFGLGCLLLAAHTGATAATVSGLAAWVVAQEAGLRSEKIGRKFGPWLLGFSFHTLRNNLWLELLNARGAGLKPGVEAVLSDLRDRAAAPWEDYFVPAELLAKGMRVGAVRLWTLPDALEVARLLGEELFDMKTLRFFSPDGAGWVETARQDIPRVISRATSAGEIRAHYREQAENLSVLLRERMSASPLARVAFELH